MGVGARTSTFSRRRKTSEKEFPFNKLKRPQQPVYRHQRLFRTNRIRHSPSTSVNKGLEGSDREFIGTADHDLNAK
ncbi:hypothetical protein J6590_018765 [Homalodisca vitripennis]|nr:hypothetical protein J6590_018765 [Homalodisca vitripennis]